MHFETVFEILPAKFGLPIIVTTISKIAPKELFRNCISVDIL